MKNLTALILILFTVFACKNEEITPVIESDYANGLVVINEGLYGQNNSSVTVITEDEILNNVYSSQNDGDFLGDTANDFLQYKNVGFIVVNNSLKIEVVDLTTFKSNGIIDFTNYGLPRTIIKGSNNFAYVTTMAHKVVKINLDTKETLDEVTVGDYPEGMTILGNYLYVANSGFGNGTTISVIDLSTFTLVNEIDVWLNPRFLVYDENYIYLSSTGMYDFEGLGAITRISPNTKTAIDTILIGQNPGEIEITDDNLFVINASGIIKIDKDSFEITDSPIISGMEVNSLYGIIYEIYYDNSTSTLFLGNPKDFTQNGDVAEYDLNGNLVERFEVGINPGKIARLTTFN